MTKTTADPIDFAVTTVLLKLSTKLKNTSFVKVTGRVIIFGCEKQKHRRQAIDRVLFALEMDELEHTREVGGRIKQDLWSVTNGDDQHWCAGFAIYSEGEYSDIREAELKAINLAAGQALIAALNNMVEVAGSDAASDLVLHCLDKLKTDEDESI